MMKKVRKFVCRLFLILLITVAVLLTVFLFIRDTVIEFAVEKFGSMLIGTPIEIVDFDSSLAGRVEITGMTIANPPQYEAPYAFKLEKIVVDIDVFSLLTDRIRINEISVCGAGLNFEQMLTSNNLGEIQDNIRAGTKEESEAIEEKTEKSGDDSAKTAVEIILLDISDTTVAFSSSALKQTIVLPLGGITFRNIGQNSTMTATEALDFVYEQVFLAVLEKSRNIGNAVIEGADVAVRQTLDVANDAAQNVVSGTQDVVQGTVSGAQDVVQGAVGGVHDAAKGIVEDAGKATQDALKNLKLW